MIKSEIITINKIENFDNNYIEDKLTKIFKNIIRWAVIDVLDNDITVSVSYII